MSRWSKRRAGRTALLPLLILALVLGGAALLLASLNLILTTTTWGQSLCQGQAQQQQQQVLPIQEPHAEAQIFFQNVWEKHQFLFEKLREERSRQRRSANRKKNHKNKSPILAAHYEVRTKEVQMNAGK